eukprot:3248753-Pyramimonas_sp.AAC.1
MVLEQVLGLLHHQDVEDSNKATYEAGFKKAGMAHRMLSIDSSHYFLPQSRVRLYTIGASPSRRGLTEEQIAVKLERIEGCITDMGDPDHQCMLTLDDT